MKATRAAGALIVLFAAFLPANVRCLQGPTNSPYANTLADFQRFMQDILDAAKNGDRQKVETILKGTEIPNCDAWLHQMYKSDSATSPAW